MYDDVCIIVVEDVFDSMQENRLPLLTKASFLHLPFLSISILLSFFILCSLHSILALEVQLPPKISIHIEPTVLVEGQEIPLVVTVIHSGSQKIAIEQISLDEPILAINEISKEVLNPSNIYSKNMSEAPVISRFRVILPAKKGGIYSIGPFHVRLGQYLFDSPEVTVNIQTPVISSDFQLNARVLNQDKSLYPGQTFTVEYRLLFKEPLKILKEDLPLLRINGLLQQASPEVISFSEGSMYVQRIQQKFKALSSGNFESGLSIIEAMRISERTYGKELIPPLYRAVAPSMNIRVEEFPQEGKPTTFYGALGSYAWRSRLLTNRSIQVGDRIQIEYRVSGRGDLSTVQFPPKESTGYVEDNFIVEIWPDRGSEEENTKTFLMELRARRPGNLIIPGITISSFDPSSAKYLTVQALPIPIVVKGREGEIFTSDQKAPIEIGITYPIAPLEIHPLSLHKRDWKILDLMWCGCICITAIGIQYAVATYLPRMKSGLALSNNQSARKMFEQGFLKRSMMRESLSLLKEAIYTRLYEVGLASEIYDSPERLNEQIPLVLEAKHILIEIDEYMYRSSSFPSQNVKQELYDNIALLYHKLKAMPSTRP